MRKHNERVKKKVTYSCTFKHSQIVLNNKRTIMKSDVLNLTGKTVDKNVTSLLNLGPNFAPTRKSIPYRK